MESGVVKKFHNSAYGYAVFPTIGKRGLGTGAAHGSGGVYRGGAKTGDVKMTQVSFGLQAGGQADTRYEKGMIVFTMGKGGLMYQAALGGQKYSYKPSK